MPDDINALLDELIDSHFPDVQGATNRALTTRPQQPLPDVAQYRTTDPGLGGRFADSFRAGDSLTEAVFASGFTDPQRYRQVKAALQARADQYPPQNALEHIASFAGGAVKQVADPIGVLAAILTKTPTQAALAGGAYEAGNSVMQNVASGESVDAKEAAASGAAGFVGAGAADVLVGKVMPDAASTFMGGVIPELAGRVVGGGVFGEGAEGAVSAGLDAVENRPREEYKQQGRRDRRERSKQQ